jgi:Tfp pilus assembly protein PilN
VNLADLASLFAIVGAVVGTTFIVVAKVTRVEVMLTQLNAELKRYDRRISELERRINERP